MGMRIALLLTLTWILGLTKPILDLSWLPLPSEWLTEEIREVSIKDLILLTGGLFLIWKSVHEIHAKVTESEHERHVAEHPTFGSVIAQIAVMDIIFSLDSVITAVGMVRADTRGIWVMITAVVLAVLVMLVFAETVSRFVERNPTLKMLALSFLLLIGVMLVAEGIGTHFNKGYIYFAMAFAMAVEVLNLRSPASSRHRRPQRRKCTGCGRLSPPLLARKQAGGWDRLTATQRVCRRRLATRHAPDRQTATLSGGLPERLPRRIPARRRTSLNDLELVATPRQRTPPGRG